MKKFLAFCWLAMLFGCGGGGGTSTTPAQQQSQTSAAFWVTDFTKAADDPAAFYQTTADKVAEGAHCYIYLERRTPALVSQAQVEAIKNEFDNVIYPSDTGAFGADPGNGVDGDPKVYILLLSIRDGVSAFNPVFLAGYFDPGNEFATKDNPNSNQHEMLYFNVNPATHVVPTSTDFYGTVAHEFQHMIHWEQKNHRLNLEDDTWLDEGMATIARTYCGYGPDYDSVLAFETLPSHSLTNWDGTVENYGVVYMWCQYIKDQLGNDIFKSMMGNNQIGIASVEAALAAAGHKKFADTFRDWSLAIFFGNSTTIQVPAGHAEWAYKSINTWPGTYEGVPLPGLFSFTSHQNATTLPFLDQWSIGFYSYTPTLAPTHAVTWTPTSPGERGTFVDAGSGSVQFDMIAGTPYSFTTKGYLVAQNPTGSPVGSSSATRSELGTIAGETFSTMTAVTAPPLMGKSTVARELAALTGRPQRISATDYLRERERGLRATGARPPF
jgi:hypothetical protein